jgi:hypothetical protein
MMLNNPLKKAAIGAVAIAALIATSAMAKPEHKSIHQRAAAVAYRHAPSESSVSAVRQHSPNPAWDVYSPSGVYIGSDPDPRIRAQLAWEYTE